MDLEDGGDSPWGGMFQPTETVILGEISVDKYIRCPFTSSIDTKLTQTRRIRYRRRSVIIVLKQRSDLTLS